MRPQNLKTKIFLDSGDPKETKEILDVLGFLDGQTTNPTLIAKNPEAQNRLAKGEKFSKEEIYDFYRGVAKEISNMIPSGSVSLEVYADTGTPADDMLKEAREMNSWIPNAHIKLPITKEGLRAAEQAVKEGIRVNLTLCFSEEQAAAVYAATRSTGSGQARGAKKGDVFISPFIGRIDDRGENGMDLIKNILQLYQSGDGHVEVLAASVRNFDHFLASLKLGADIITAPSKVLKEWKEKELLLPGEDYIYGANNLKSVSYREIDLNKDWREYDIFHELTDKGIERFSNDWNALIK